jgi:hypothetical protein
VHRRRNARRGGAAQGLDRLRRIKPGATRHERHRALSAMSSAAPSGSPHGVGRSAASIAWQMRWKC